MAKFTAVSAPKLPKIACIGTVANVADTKPSESGAYNVTNIGLEPRGGGFKTQFALLTRPEWLVPGFSPDVELEGNDSAKFVYRTNIMGPQGSGVSRLLGIAGSEDASEALVDDIFASVETTKDETGNTYSYVGEEKLTSVIRKHATRPVGYILTQKMEDTGEKDEEGRKVKIRTSNYELGQLFYPSESSLKRYRKLAAEKPDEWKVGFDEAF